MKSARVFLILLMAPMLAGSLFAQAPVQLVTLRTPFFQKGSPLKIIGIGMEKPKDFLSKVWLVNVSDQTVHQYRLGWLVTDREKAGPGTAFLGQAFDTRLKPSTLEVTGRQGANVSTVLDTVRAKGISNGEVVVGVVSVKFADGSEWSYPLQQQRQFESEYDYNLHLQLTPMINEQVTPMIHELLRQAGAPASVQASGKRQSAPGGQPGYLAQLLGWWKSLKNWFSVPTVYAQCPIPVCNPGGISWNCYTWGQYCYQDPCGTPGPGCNWMKCGYVPC